MHRNTRRSGLAALLSVLALIGSVAEAGPFGASVPMQQRAPGNY